MLHARWRFGTYISRIAQRSYRYDCVGHLKSGALVSPLIIHSAPQLSFGMIYFVCTSLIVYVRLIYVHGVYDCADHFVVCRLKAYAAVLLFEPPHDKTNKVACAPSESEFSLSA